MGSANRNLLFASNETWAVNKLPAPFDAMKMRFSLSGTTLAPALASILSPSSKIMAVNAAIVKCLLTEADPSILRDEGSISLVKVADAEDLVWYAAEMDMKDGSVIVVEYMINPDTKVASLYASSYSAGAHVASALPPFRGKNAPMPLSVLYLPILSVMLTISADLTAEYNSAFRAISEVAATTEPMTDECAEKVARLSHLFYSMIDDGVKDGHEDRRFSVKFVGGAIPQIPRNHMMSGNKKAAYADGEVVLGTAPFLMGTLGSLADTASDVPTIGSVKKEFEAFNSNFSWTAEEQLFIPQFPDDMPVPQETIEIARAYVNSRDMKTPMVNFMWRGITSFGKSTGVKMLACVLNRPLLRQTCFPSMETADFLSAFVPDNGPSYVGEVPSVEDMYLDPEGSWSKMTGEEREGVTAQECLEELLSRSAKSNGTAKFKHVPANYVKALSKGYIIELSEVSRIREPGVLVGLDDYDAPGAVIPLVDGTYVRRHRDAICVMTDNVGYVSCRPVDPAVIRRQAFTIDSYDMPKDMVLDRIRYNTGYKDDKNLELMYKIWKEIADYCGSHEITEGAVSMTELERWVQKVQIDGGKLYENCIKCVIAKATSNREDQNELISAILDTKLSSAA